MNNFNTPSRHEESSIDSLESMRVFIEAYNEIMRLLGLLYEAGPAMDPKLRAARRARITQLMESLGLDPDEPESINILEECYHDTMQRALKPVPQFEVPDVAFFEDRIPEVVRTRSPKDSLLPVFADPTFSEVAEYGWTDWGTVHSRSGIGSIAQWTHGVASVISDPVAYCLTFPDIDSVKIGEDWEIVNGRHRSLAAVCLGAAGIYEANSWVPIHREFISA